MRTLQDIFERYGFMPAETPVLCHYDILASKYAGGAEILKEIYTLQDQGGRDLALRYDLTVPFARLIGMNPNMRMPFRRYEIGKVFRDGPVKTGRLREFTQCDVDVVGIESVLAETEIIALISDVFAELGLGIYISVNHREFLAGLLSALKIPTDMISSVVLSLDKIEKLGAETVWLELKEKGLERGIIDALAEIYQKGKNAPGPEGLAQLLPQRNRLIERGMAELAELNTYLNGLGLTSEVRFNPFLARGLEIYTGTIFEVFVSDGTIASSLAAGGRYNKIIGSFLGTDQKYPAIGISFGLEPIFQILALTSMGKESKRQGIYVIPIETKVEALRVVQSLRKKGHRVEMEMSGRRVRRALDYANRENFKYVIFVGEDEVRSKQLRVKNMDTGEEEFVTLG